MNAQSNERFHVYSVVNNAAVLARDLQSSPDIANGSMPLSPLWNERSASEGYAKAIAGATAAIMIFLHQDVYLPAGWFELLEKQIERLDHVDPDWAVAGSSGLTHNGEYVGHLWDSGLGVLLGRAFAEPVRSACLDETILILRRASAVSFDPQMPTFHLYGTDIVLTAEARGKSAYMIHLPIVHNTSAHRRFLKDYRIAYRFMVRKWRHRLPWPTLIVPLKTTPWALLYRALITPYNRIFHPEMFSVQLADPSAKARALGFEPT